MRNAICVALFACAAFGLQSVQAASTIGTPTAGDIVVCCRPMPTTVYIARITGEIADDDAADKLETLVKSLSGVVRVRIDRETKEVRITMDRHSSLTKEDVEKALKGSDFGITELTDVSDD